MRYFMFILCTDFSQSSVLPSEAVSMGTSHISGPQEPLWLVGIILDNAGIGKWFGLSNALECVMGKVAKIMGCIFP